MKGDRPADFKRPPPPARGLNHGSGSWGKGRGKSSGGKSSYSSVHDPTNRDLPYWLEKVGDKTGEAFLSGSVVCVDSRELGDGRMVSPFQGLFPAEIAENANSSINILTERSQLMENSKAIRTCCMRSSRCISTSS